MGVRGRCGSGEGEGFGVGAGEVGLGVDLGAVDFDGDGVLVFGLLAVEGHADKGWDVGDFAVGVEECFGVGGIAWGVAFAGGGGLDGVGSQWMTSD